MTHDMQRYEGPSIPRDQGSYVLASDAEAAIAAAEQRGKDEAIAEFQSNHDWMYQQGQRDMLAKCIEAVKATQMEPEVVFPLLERLYAIGGLT